MNRDEVKGKVNELKGRAKQAAGHLTGDERLHDEGAADEVAGKVRGAVGTGRRKVGEAVERIGRGIKK